MKHPKSVCGFLPCRRKFFFALALAFLFLWGCDGNTAPGTPGNPGAQATASGWKARRYLYSTAWASVSSLSTMDVLGDSEQSVLQNGYVTTDKSGQARVRMGSDCTVYIFQNSASTYSGETISTCSKDSPSTCSNDFSAMISDHPGCKIKLASIPATVTFNGTVGIILQYMDLDSIVILMSEGTAVVTPTKLEFPAFEIPAGKAAYMTTAGFIGQANAFFGFKPGDIVDFQAMVVPIEKMDRIAQVQRANLLLSGRNLPLVPLPDSYQLSLHWLNLSEDRIPNASRAVAQYVNWGDLLGQPLFEGIPLLIQIGDQTVDLRGYEFSPAQRDQSGSLLAEAGLSAGQEIVIGFDESIPGVESLAAAIQKALEGLLTAAVKPFNPQSDAYPFAALEKEPVPVLILGGY